MAGDTSRVLKTLIVPSFAAACFLTILLMKKKRQSRKTASATNSNSLTSQSLSSSTKIEAKEAQLVLPCSVASDCHLSAEATSAEMLYKEKKATSTKSSDARFQSGASESQSKKTAIMESKALENLSICERKFGEEKEATTNGVSHSQNKDKIDSNASVSIKQKGAVVRVNGSCLNGNHTTDLVNGFNSLSLKGSNTNVPHANSESQTEESDVLCCKKLSSETKVNGDMSFSGVLAAQTDNSSALIVENCVSQDISAMSELSCDTNFIPPKAATPDSGVSGELHESDGASSSMSEPTSECALSGLGDMLKSPVTSVSSDSGKDCSENQYEIDQLVPGAVPDEPSLQVYEFEIPQELCGYLIGKNGRHVKFIKEESNAEIYIKHHPLLPPLKTCAVTGTEDEIDIALSIIRERFPSEKFPDLTLEPISLVQPECTLPITLKLALPEGVTFDAILSATVTPGHFFLQQPTHPTYHTLPLLTSGMSQWYNEFEAPKLVRVTCDAIVAVPYAGLWYRAQVAAVLPDTQQCTVRFLDYGGYETYDLSELRQMRFEFAQVPFQATECYLGSVTYPEGETAWSELAKAKFEELAQGQIIQGYIVGYDQSSGVPLVHLYSAQGATAVFINKELVNAGFARWTNQGVEEEENTVTSETEPK